MAHTEEVRTIVVTDEEVKFIRIREVMAITGKSRSTLYADIKRGTFPASIKIGCKASAWIKQEVLRWANDRIAESRAASKK